MPQTAKLIGGPGTGKTRALLEIADNVIERVRDPLLVGFSSFTRAARREASTRAAETYNMRPIELEKDGWFRTVHSICHRQLNVRDRLLTDCKADREWLMEMLQESVRLAADDGEPYAEPFVTAGETEDADRAIAIWDVARNRLDGLETVWRDRDETDDRTPSLGYCKQIVERYESAKRIDGRLDFTDLLAAFAGYGFSVDEGAYPVAPHGDPPDNVEAWLFDEQQDSSALQAAVIRRIVSGDNVKWVYLCGDPFQCQPAGTMVQTKEGPKPIEQLDPSVDCLVSYSRKEGRFRGMGNRVPFRVAHRTVDSSNTWSVHTEDGDVLRATGGHKWLYRLVPCDKFAVYLMQRGPLWRIGTCMLLTKNPGRNGTFRLGQRSRLEKADCAWILSVHDSDRDARIREQVVSCRYGLPQVAFEPPISTAGKTNLNRAFIDAVFAGIGDLTQNAITCLRHHGRSLAFPVWQRGKQIKRGENITSETQTYNLESDFMVLPKVVEELTTDGRSGKREKLTRRVKWVCIVKIVRGPANVPIEVYSLDVEKHHTYIADGYVTCNSIYGWAGADARHFLAWPADKTRVMDRSYRCAAEILALGERLIGECSDYFDRKIAPRESGGIIDETWLPCLTGEIDPRDEWLVLTRTNWHARRIARLLDDAAYPWAPTRGHKTGGGHVQVAAIEALIAIQAGAPIDGWQWQQILKQKIPAAPYFVRGTKARFASMEDAAERYPFEPPHELDALGATELFLAAVRSGEWTAWIPGAEHYIAALAAWGEDLVRQPRIRVGTVHSAKGAQADNVAVLTSLSRPCALSARSDAGRDEEQRVKYVAATRARNRLLIVKEQGVPFRWRME